MYQLAELNLNYLIAACFGIEQVTNHDLIQHHPFYIIAMLGLATGVMFLPKIVRMLRKDDNSRLLGIAHEDSPQRVKSKRDRVSLDDTYAVSDLSKEGP